jgi:folate-dependent phosphoribosylglycinamide formyltransferase PurN
VRLIQTLNPRLIVINGTSILSHDLIDALSVPIINIHAGITPEYRGVHGAYWALVQQDQEHCGVTIHFVDAGIDTGNVLEQAVISPTSDDNYSTYPLLQVAEGVRLLNGTVRSILENEIQIQSESSCASRCWTHPTIWQYLKNRFEKKIK